MPVQSVYLSMIFHTVKPCSIGLPFFIVYLSVGNTHFIVFSFFACLYLEMCELEHNITSTLPSDFIHLDMFFFSFSFNIIHEFFIFQISCWNLIVRPCYEFQCRMEKVRKLPFHILFAVTMAPINFGYSKLTTVTNLLI